MSFVASIQTEIADLELSLKERPDPRLVKLHELRRLLALYRGEASTQAFEAFHDREEDIQKPERKRQSGGRKMSPERQRAIELLRDLLWAESRPIKISDLHSYLVKNGVVLAGKNPLNNLSALLYTLDEFKSHGREGWTLTESRGSSRNEKPSDENTLAGTSEGFDFDTSRPVEPVPGGGA